MYVCMYVCMYVYVYIDITRHLSYMNTKVYKGIWVYLCTLYPIILFHPIYPVILYISNFVVRYVAS